MAMYYYYIDGETKKGPYTIAELQALNLPVETLVWSDGWSENKPISECPEVMDYLTLTPPSIPLEPQAVEESAPQQEEADDVQEYETITIEPEIHWLPKVLMVLGIIGAIREFVSMLFVGASDEFALYAVALVVEAIAIIGMLAKKKWALITYFVMRCIADIILLGYINVGLVDGDAFLKESLAFLIIIGIFFIKRDGYNVYETLWNNGTIQVKKEKTEEGTETSDESTKNE